MSVKRGRAVLGSAAGALSDTHRGTHRTQLSHTEGNEPTVGCSVVNVFREVGENDPHCRRIFVSISHLPVCQALTSPSAHVHRAEQRKWFNEVKPREEFFPLLFCLSGYVTPLQQSFVFAMRLFRPRSQGASLQLRVVPCVLLLYIVPQSPAGVVPAWIWDENRAHLVAGICLCFTLGGLESEKTNRADSQHFFAASLCPEGGIDFPVLCHSTEGGKACRQTVTHWQAPEATSQLNPSRTDWCCKARELISIKDIMLKGP